MHHEIEFNLSGSSLAIVLTDIHDKVAFTKPSEEQPEAQLLMARRRVAYPRGP